jgi:hypothetical protein
LSSFCRYGVGVICTPGFGAWLNLATHVLTTNWLRADDHKRSR